jgi:phenol/toluene 2-monooxygenase (NADH) P4/A4
MTVTAIREYVGAPRDVVANYHGNLLIYVTWERHLMFACAMVFPVAPAMKFEDFLTQMLAGVIQDHPDAAKIDWRKTVWRKEEQPWAPDFDASFADNGIEHKGALSFRTPGLDGIRGLGI